MAETQDPTEATSGESTLTVLIAFGANLAVAVAKTVAAVITGSASMTAEAAHSWADSGNQGLLAIANRRSRRPPDADRPFGYGREAYVWSLLAAVGLFVVGGSLSVWHGVTELRHPESGPENYLVAYIVLAVAFALESVSLIQAVRQLRAEAHRYDKDLLDHVLDTSDPTTRAVFAEDTAALIGILIAAAGIGLHQLTGDAAWDAIGSILVGLLLGVIAVILIDRNRRFLVGEPASPRVREAAIERIRGLTDVAEVRFVRLVFVGPKQLFLVASVDLRGDAVESRVAETLRRLETQLQADPYIVDAVLTIAEPDELEQQSIDGS
ncbi:cation diffusion facilitator family transporter [Mycobacterium sp. 852002-51961_SCH5331710]|uniref:cation diffusion facilitator family transporter n=1 Tax=Mycobacterium sp. 852002-51961_SCH5331710 TaxID=1834105 RepID=UPI0007FF22F7|nr:cation diffusion facilitator family transporter [Mycobacterium sp. 852002-51961_SCH5331710]OBB48341.1 cation diffusion facilitator family transporter [Mycobacterium sp. 852002-51961_SCH5331710]